MAKVTKRYTNQKLSAKQQKALAELLSGKTDGEAAKAAGVSRKTISIWKNDDLVFQAEFNRRKLEVWEDFLNELNLTVTDSMATIRQAIRDGDVKTARWFFDKLGFGDFVRKNITLSKPKEPTDPEDIRKEKIRKQARELANEDLKRASLEDPFFIDMGEGDQLTEKYYQRLLDASQD